MNILVTNDDGVHAPGLAALARELSKTARVTVVAPDRERSAVGHSLTFFHPLRVDLLKKSKALTVYATDGSPTDCVLLGIKHILEEQPHLVISGINAGGNLGDDLTYSGTVAAAMEGTIHGVPSIAISLAAVKEADFTAAAIFARRLARLVAHHGLPERTLLNVNVPPLPRGQIKGIRITHQGRSIYHQHVERRLDPRGREYFWVYGDYPQGAPEAGTDFAALAEDHISITPLCLHFACHDDDGLFRHWGALKELRLS